MPFSIKEMGNFGDFPKELLLMSKEGATKFWKLLLLIQLTRKVQPGSQSEEFLKIALGTLAGVGGHIEKGWYLAMAAEC